MAGEKKPYKPQAKPADEIIAWCQKGIRLYPARLALTDKAFDKIKHSGNAPELPEGIPQPGDDYDLRRLRDGWVYILAVNAQSDYFSITGEAKNGWAWYIYRYRNENNRQGFSQWSTETFKKFIEEQTQQEASAENAKPDTEDNHNDVASEEKTEGSKSHPTTAMLNSVDTIEKQKPLTDYIELNRAICNTYIMYSDFELPYSLLKKIETSETTKSLWMRKINIQEPSGAATDLQKLTEVVADFSLQDLNIENQVTNCHRYTPIGRLKNWQDVADRITYGKGVIVALEDPIGSIRDLACYHGYLDEMREKVLAKYEYAIRTASFIHSHAQEKILYNFNRKKEVHKAVKEAIENKNPWFISFAGVWERLYKKPMTVPAPEALTLAQSYKQYTKVAPIHIRERQPCRYFHLIKTRAELGRDSGGKCHP